MKVSNLQVVLVGVAVVVIGTASWLLFGTSGTKVVEVVPEPVTEKVVDPLAIPLGRLESALAAIAISKDKTENRRTLAELRTVLFELPPEVAAEAIIRFLDDPAKDAATGLPLRVGPGGKLDSAGAFRVALLDWLGQISPEKAGMVAERILGKPTDPDEWAMCLRNHAWAHPGGENADFLRGKTEELILREEWREKPTAGYLEAFDVLVYAKAVDSAPLLARLAADTSPGGKAGAHAAFLTMDRLVIGQRAEMMERLLANKELLARRGGMVAEIVARADLREERESELVSRFLLDTVRSAAELDAFAAIYPNMNYMVSDSLLTTDRPPSGDEIRVRDAAALAKVTAWLGDTRYNAVKPWLERIRTRLATFAK